MFLLSPYPEDDYCMGRKAAKTKRKKPEGLCRVRFVTSSMFLSLEYNPFTVCFHQLLLCTEPGRICPRPPKTGVALMGSNTECVIIREGAFFKP